MGILFSPNYSKEEWRGKEKEREISVLKNWIVKSSLMTSGQKCVLTIKEFSDHLTFEIPAIFKVHKSIIA